MTTNIKNGNYPLPDDLLLFTNLPDFDELWKNEIQFYTEVPQNWKDSDLFKTFATQILDIYVKYNIENKEKELYKYVQEIANEAYQDGVEDSYKEGFEIGMEEGKKMSVNAIEDCMNKIVKTMKTL